MTAPRTLEPGPGPAASGAAPAARLWQPTHRHRKGGLYRFLARAVNEADGTALAVYEDAAGTIWARSLSEFEDGRFTPV